MKAILFPVLALAMLAGCKSRDAASAESTPDEQAPMTYSGPTLNDPLEFNRPTDPFQVNGEPVVEGNTLKLVVEYSGGCRDHVFQMVTNGMLMKSLPPQRPVRLIHQANEDMCRSMIIDTLTFDLTPLAAPEGGRIKLNLQAAREFSLECVLDSNR